MPLRFENQLRVLPLCMAPFKSLKLCFCRTDFGEFGFVLCLGKFSINIRLFLLFLVEFGLFCAKTSRSQLAHIISSPLAVSGDPISCSLLRACNLQHTRAQYLRFSFEQVYQPLLRAVLCEILLLVSCHYLVF